MAITASRSALGTAESGTKNRRSTWNSEIGSSLSSNSCEPCSGWSVSRALTDLGQVRVLQGQFAHARALGAEGIALSRELGDRREVASYLEIFAASEAGQGDAGRAARLWGAADRLLESVGSPLLPEGKILRDRYFDSVKESLGEGPFQAALSKGRAMSLTQAVQYALAEIGSPAPPDAEKIDE